jgi:hypothetical protein
LVAAGVADEILVQVSMLVLQNQWESLLKHTEHQSELN